MIEFKNNQPTGITWNCLFLWLVDFGKLWRFILLNVLYYIENFNLLS